MADQVSGGRCTCWAWTRANYYSGAGAMAWAIADAAGRGKSQIGRLPAACGKCLPGSEPTEVCMVRRRSTVRFRKGAPGYVHFSNMKPDTFLRRVSFEWQTLTRTGACARRFAAGWAPRSDSYLGNRS